KRVVMFFVPLMLALMVSSAKAADDGNGKGGEAKQISLTVSVGCANCNFHADTGATHCAAAAKAGDKVYLLKGTAVPKDFKKGGDYVVKGTLAADGTTIEVTEMTKKG